MFFIDIKLQASSSTQTVPGSGSPSPHLSIDPIDPAMLPPSIDTLRRLAASLDGGTIEKRVTLKLPGTAPRPSPNYASQETSRCSGRWD
jgi:hypothetical protein